jgi:hypothetical protein
MGSIKLKPKGKKRFELLIVATVKIPGTAMWYVVPCSLAEM